MHFLPLFFLPAVCCFYFDLNGQVNPIDTLSPGNWMELPDTKIRSVVPAPKPSGDPAAIILAWGGGTVDARRSRLLVWGGGHNDYYGNELYALDLPSRRMLRLTDPDYDCYCALQCSSSGNPPSRHTYDRLAYLAHADIFFVFGGSAACPTPMGAQTTFVFDFTTGRWSRTYPSGTMPNHVQGSFMTAYDTATRLLFLDDMSGLYTYHHELNRYAKIAPHSTVDYHCTAAIDPKRRKFVMIGDGIKLVDLNTGAMTVLSTSNAPAFVTGKQSPGIDYDPVADRMVCWHGGGNVYALDLDAATWTQVAANAGPTQAAPYQGTFGRWGYVPGFGVFTLVNSIDQNGWVFRYSPAPSKVERHAGTILPGLEASPNPFNFSVSIRLPKVLNGGTVTLRVLDTQGRVVADLSSSLSASGARFDAAGLRSGIYIAEWKAGDRTYTCKMMRLR